MRKLCDGTLLAIRNFLLLIILKTNAIYFDNLPVTNLTNTAI